MTPGRRGKSEVKERGGNLVEVLLPNFQCNIIVTRNSEGSRPPHRTTSMPSLFLWVAVSFELQGKDSQTEIKWEVKDMVRAWLKGSFFSNELLNNRDEQTFGVVSDGILCSSHCNLESFSWYNTWRYRSLCSVSRKVKCVVECVIAKHCLLLR